MTGQLDPALEAARRGEEWGVARLWQDINPALERYLTALVGQSAQDVASETWLQAARDLRGFRGDADGLRVWLFRTARNRAVDELRRQGRRPEEPLAEPSRLEPAAPDDTAAAAAERIGTARALELVRQLPKDQAEAVLLRVVAGLDANRSALILGKRPGAVRIAAMRGLRSLAEKLERSEPREDDAAAGDGRRTAAEDQTTESLVTVTAVPVNPVPLATVSTASVGIAPVPAKPGAGAVSEAAR